MRREEQSKKVGKKVTFNKFLIGLLFMFGMNTTAYASGGNLLLESAPVQAFISLLNDASKLIMVVGPLVCGCVAGYYYMRMSAADTQNQPEWKKRITTALESAVGIFAFGGVMLAITAYFK